MILNKYIPHSPTVNQLAFLRTENLEVFFGGAAGGGKILADDGVVLTPFGWKQGKDLQIGDLINNPDGTVQRVIQIKARETLEKWTVCFSDGTMTDVAESHLWLAWYNRHGRKINNVRISGRDSAQVIETRELKEWVDRGYAPQIPVCAPQAFNRSRREHNALDPYLLGVLLGDGCITERHLLISADSRDMPHYKQYLPDTEDIVYSDRMIRFRGELRKHIVKKLRLYGVYGTNSATKFIPEVYKFGYIDDRWALVQGLMDTDGWSAREKNACYFDTISTQLAYDVADVLRGLGCTVTITKNPAGYKKNGEYIHCNDCYSLYIRCVDPDKLFRMKRKQHGCFGKNLVQKRVVAVERGGEITGRCITVNNPNGLYITNDFIVTHNSEALLMAALLFSHLPDYHAIIIRDSLRNLEQADALIPRSVEWLGPTDAQWKEQKHQWVFPSGSTLTFGYMDGPRDHFQYQGAAFQFVGIDEAVAIREHQADYMFSRMRRLAGSPIPLRIRLASNPPAREQAARGAWVKRRYVDQSTKKPGALYIPSKLADNPYLDQTEYRKSLMNLDPVTREQLLNGDWEIQAEGGYFRMDWIRYCDHVPEDEIEMRVRYWDMAATEEKVTGKQPDQTAGVRIARTTDGRWIIENVVTFRKSPRETERMIQDVAAADGKNTPIRMEMEGGSGGKITISHYTRNVLAGYDFRGHRPEGSKTQRAAPFASQMEQGNVYLLNAGWNAPYIEELLLFPTGAHDDQVDASSGAFNYLAPGRGNSPNVYVL